MTIYWLFFPCIFRKQDANLKHSSSLYMMDQIRPKGKSCPCAFQRWLQADQGGEVEIRDPLCPSQISFCQM